MSVSIISGMTDDIKREIDDADGDISNSDPEIWEHMFAEDFVDSLKNCEPSKTPEETAAYRDLYAHVKKVVDEALLPIGLSEAIWVVKFCVPDVLVGIAKKDKTVAAEILADLNATYAKDEDEDVSGAAKSIARKIEKRLAPPAPKKRSVKFTAAAAPVEGGHPVFGGKTILFTGTLSVTRAEATKLATDIGAKVAGTVSKNTDFVVAGQDTGAKLGRAASLGVTILTEREWRDMIAGKPAPDKDKITVFKPLRLGK